MLENSYMFESGNRPATMVRSRIDRSWNDTPNQASSVAKRPTPREAGSRLAAGAKERRGGAGRQRGLPDANAANGVDEIAGRGGDKRQRCGREAVEREPNEGFHQAFLRRRARDVGYVSARSWAADGRDSRTSISGCMPSCPLRRVVSSANTRLALQSRRAMGAR